MPEKKDRRSKRDKFKDGIINDIKDQIEKRERLCEHRTAMNEADAIVVCILKEQLENIHKLCEKEGDENKS